MRQRRGNSNVPNIVTHSIRHRGCLGLRFGRLRVAVAGAIVVIAFVG